MSEINSSNDNQFNPGTGWAGTLTMTLLPALSLLLDATGSVSSAETELTLSKLPTPLIVVITVMVSLLPLDKDGIVHGKAEQLVELTDVMVKFEGVSVTTTLLAVSGPLLVTTKVYWIL